jgi:iron-sulfur cluster assembly protein
VKEYIFMTTTPTLETISPAVTLTEAARKQVHRILQKKNLPDAFLRVGVRGGGCSGLSYMMQPDTETDEFDLTWLEPDGLRVVVDPKSVQFLQGTVLDYSTKNLLEGGFKFQNPNAAKSCGCGTSFTPRD